MKILVVLENHFIQDKNGVVWCERVVDYGYLKRYLDVFDGIVVCGRCEKVKEIDKKTLLKVSGEGVDFLPLPDFKGAKGFLKNYHDIQELVRGILPCVDGAIMRAPTHLSLAVYSVLIKEKIPFALEFMMAANQMVEGMWLFKYILNPIIDHRFKKMCKEADGVSYVTERVLQERYPCKAILDPGDRKFFTANYSSIDLLDSFYHKRKIMPQKKTCRLVHVGYMDSERKGQDIVILATGELKASGYEVKLDLIGDGCKREEFEELAKAQSVERDVRFYGNINKKEELAEILRQADFFVFPTISEGLPRVVIEAMANSLVCLATPVDGIPELLDEGFLVERRPEAYFEKIEYLLEHPEVTKRNSENNYKKALNYRKELIDHRRRAFYNKLREKCKSNG